MLHEFSTHLGDLIALGCAIVITGDFDGDRISGGFPVLGIARAPIILVIPIGDRQDGRVKKWMDYYFPDAPFLSNF